MVGVASLKLKPTPLKFHFLVVLVISQFAPQGAEYCPETASLKWEWYGTKPDNSLGWIEDSDAGLRCSDCAKFPNADECSKKVLSGWVIHFFHH